MRQLIEDVSRCLSEGRYDDAHTVVVGTLAAAGFKTYDDRDLNSLVQILACMEKTADMAKSFH